MIATEAGAAAVGARCLRRVTEYLDRSGVAYQVGSHDPEYTARDIARAEHVPGASIADVIPVMADRRLLLVLIPATSRLELSWVGEAIGAARVRIATEAELVRAFPDCEVGAIVPPFGNLYRVPVLMDRGLTRGPVIVFGAGAHDLSITMTVDDFARLARPKIGIFAAHAQALAS